MAQFSCDALREHFSSLFASCYVTPSAERQRQSREKLEQQKTFLAYEIKQLEGQVEECERRKASLLHARRVKEAKEVVRQKFKLTKKYEKTRELYEFTDTLLEQIANTYTLRDTIGVINDAQRVYLSVDQTKIYSRYAKLSEKFGAFQERVEETQDALNQRMAGALGGSADDAELLKELEACDNPDTPLPPLPASLTPPRTVEPIGISSAYARAGLHAGG